MQHCPRVYWCNVRDIMIISVYSRPIYWSLMIMQTLIMINLECWCFNCQLICLQYWIRNLLWIHFRTIISIHNVGDYGKMPSNQPCPATYILILWSYIIYVVQIWILATYCRCIIFRGYLFSWSAEPKSIREYINKWCIICCLISSSIIIKLSCDFCPIIWLPLHTSYTNTTEYIAYICTICNNNIIKVETSVESGGIL